MSRQVLESCFRPCPGRLLNLHEDNVELPFGFSEIELVVDHESIIQNLQQQRQPDNDDSTISLAEFLGFTSDSIVWLSEYCFLVEVRAHAELSRFDTSERSGLTPYLRFELSNMPNTPRQRLFLWMSDTEVVTDNDDDDTDTGRQRLGALQPAVEWVLALVKLCQSSFVKLGLGFTDEEPTMMPVSAAALQAFLSQNEALQHLVLFRFQISPDCCRVLGMARMDKLELVEVLLEDAEAFSQGLEQNGGPRRLYIIDGRGHGWLENILGALESNKRLESFMIRANGHSLLDAVTTQRIAPALEINSSLVSLSLVDCPLASETWSLFWQHLQRNKGIKTLSLSNEFPDLAKSRTRQVAEALKHNKTLEGISMNHHDEEVWRKEVAPCLARNKYLPRWVAIQNNKDEHFRRALVAKGMGQLRYCPRLLYLGLHSCIDLVVDGTAPAKAPPMLFLNLKRIRDGRQRQRKSSLATANEEPDLVGERSTHAPQSAISVTLTPRPTKYRSRAALLAAVKLTQVAFFLLSSRDNRRELWCSVISAS